MIVEGKADIPEYRSDASRGLMMKGRRFITGGASSNIRQFRQVLTEPVFIHSAKGAVVTDADGNRYFDFINGLGPLISGHGDSHVDAAMYRQIEAGILYATPCEGEVNLASVLCGAIPFLEQVRFVASGTEAAMTAVRLARAFTRRASIIKFEGSYHGHADALLTNVRKGMLDDTSDGARESGSTHPGVLMARYNDLESVERLFASHASEIAAVVVEPVASNMGVVPPSDGFLEGLREMADRYGALLIADEVVSAFRYRYGSICTRFGVTPDLIALGKIIGGGVSIGAYGGRADIMELLSRPGGVFQGGTFAANPLAMAAGLAQLEVLAIPGQYERLDRLGEVLSATLNHEFRAAGLPFSSQRFGSLVTPILVEGKSRLFSLEDVRLQDRDLFAVVHRTLASKGFLLAPSIESPAFLSLAHDEHIVRQLGLAFVEAVVSARRRHLPGR